MKILWIVNTPIDILSEKLYQKKANCLWMDALLSDCRKNHVFDLVVATTAKVSNTLKYVNDGVTFYAIPNNPPILYNENKNSNIIAWREMIGEERPDIVQIWGTEFSHGLCALKVCKEYDIPSVIYMQGYLGSIARHYLAGMTVKEVRQSITFRDFLKHDNILNQQKKYFYAAKREKEEFHLSGRIICENDWCESSIRAVSPNINVYRCPLSINNAFSNFNWNIDKKRTHSIICNASGYSIKGLHMLLRAVALLKVKYPDIKLYVPGMNMDSNTSLELKLRKRGYTKYIESLIKSLGIKNNIVWLGQISQEKLAEQYTKAHVFVLCSAIENHSSSLKEAMMVGLPCVAAAVGGVPEYVRHGENGFLYRFEEYEIAASYIDKLFEEDTLSQKLSNSAREDMIKLHSSDCVFEKTFEIYLDILGEKK